MKTETRKQVMARIDKIMDAQAKGHLVCRTCGEAGCSILAHNNTLPAVKGDKFVKHGEVIIV